MKKLLAVLTALTFGLLAAVPAQGASQSYSAKAVVLMEAASGRILYAQNENEPVSYTHLMHCSPLPIRCWRGTVQQRWRGWGWTPMWAFCTAPGLDGSALHWT